MSTSLMVEEDIEEEDISNTESLFLHSLNRLKIFERNSVCSEGSNIAIQKVSFESSSLLLFVVDSVFICIIDNPRAQASNSFNLEGVCKRRRSTSGGVFKALSIADIPPSFIVVDVEKEEEEEEEEEEEG